MGNIGGNIVGHKLYEDACGANGGQPIFGPVTQPVPARVRRPRRRSRRSSRTSTGRSSRRSKDTSQALPSVMERRAMDGPVYRGRSNSGDTYFTSVSALPLDGGLQEALRESQRTADAIAQVAAFKKQEEAKRKRAEALEEKEKADLAKAIAESAAMAAQETDDDPPATTPMGSLRMALQKAWEEAGKEMADREKAAGDKIVDWLMNQIPDAAEVDELAESIIDDEKNCQTLIEGWDGKAFYAVQTGEDPSAKANEFLYILGDNFWNFLPVRRTDFDFKKWWKTRDPGRDIRDLKDYECLGHVAWLGFWKNCSKILFGTLEAQHTNLRKYTYVVEANKESTDVMIEMRKFESSKNLDSACRTKDDNKMETIVLKTDVNKFLEMLQNPQSQTITDGNPLEIPKTKTCEWTFVLKSSDGKVTSRGNFQTWLGPCDSVLPQEEDQWYP